MDAANGKICAVILNIADTPGLVDCLRSLDKATYPDLEVIVVHNGPRCAEFEEAVRAASHKVGEVVFTGFNAGFAAGNNAGIVSALERGADYVLLLNDDTEAAPDFLDLLAAEARKVPDAGMLGPRIFYFSEPEKIWFSGARFNREECVFSFPGADQAEAAYGHYDPEAADYITGCALLVSRKLIETVGALDESFFLYWEDSDWGLRAAAAGFKSVVVPRARIWHKVSASSGGTDSALKAYHKTRGQLLFASIHAPSARNLLIRGYIKDLLWLLIKSGKPGRFKKFAAILAGVIHYFTGRTGSGPRWLA